MIKKELREVSNYIFWSSIILLLAPFCFLCKISLQYIFTIPMIAWLNIVSQPTGHDYLLLFIIIFALLILVDAHQLGLTMFAKEHKDQAFEYLLSFPRSKSLIIFQKILVRLFFILILTGCYEILSSWFINKYNPVHGAFFYLINPQYFLFWVLYLFIIGVSFSIFEQKDIMVIVTLATALATILSSLAINSIFQHSFQKDATALAWILGMTIVSVILIFAFVLTYQQLDVRPMALHIKRFIVWTLPPLGALSVAGGVVLLCLGF